MATRPVRVRLSAEGGGRVRAELEGVGEAGARGMGRLARETEMADARLLAGRWVAGLAAAALSVGTLSKALVVLRGALIRTGIGALIVGAGELIYQFSRLVSGAGGFAAALSALKDVAVEVWNRIRMGAAALGAKIAAVFFDLKADAASAMQSAIESVVAFGNAAANTFEGAYEAIKAVWGQLPNVIGDLAFRAANFLIKGVEAMVQGLVDRINKFIDRINGVVRALPDWAVGENPTLIDPLGDVNFGGIDNPYEGAAADTAAKAAAAFRKAFEDNPFATPDLGLGDIAREASAEARTFQTAFEDFSKTATLPLSSLKELRRLMADAAKETENGESAARRLNDALETTARTGGGVAKASRDAATGWKAVGESLAEYAREAGDRGKGLAGVLTGAFKSAETAFRSFIETGKVDFKGMIRSMIADLALLNVRTGILAPIAKSLSGSFGGGATGGGLLSGLFGGTPAAVPSFAGGGFTGPGARSGGLDGKGGFWAMLHPNESVVDHTRGRHDAAPVQHITINQSFAPGTDARTIRKGTAAGIRDARLALGAGGVYR